MSDPPSGEEAIFNAALKLPAGQRAAYLQEVCGGDAQLRASLEALLQAAAPTTGPEKTMVVSWPLTEKPGDKIGRYKLLQQIGEGGCGIVYMAEQEEPVKRRVALKVIKPGMDSKEVLGRFEAERQALALMDHTNICKVLDAGATDNGRPFFVMELVKGIPITRYCDENKLKTEQRLELFIHVCQAIQHAHQKGIIHRDIKPSNILVADQEGAPVPKVIDFGIAKATAGQMLTNKTIFTALEQFIGTPAYMSPEQANLSGLDIDTRSDIYSLGVLLYELLTGKTPFDARRLLEAGFDEIRRIIREEEPPRPSQKLSTLAAEEQTTTAKARQTDSPRLLHLVRGDLDWIVMKCLEKDRNRRYETANGLVHDIMRHVKNEPVLARPPSQIYRFSKLVGRNKLAFAATAAVLAALVIGLGVSIWSLNKERQARQKANAEAERAQAAEILAKQRLAESESISKFLTEVFQSPDPARDGRTITVAESLDLAAKKLDTDLSNQPALRAKLQATLGRTYKSLGLFGDAISLQEKVYAYDLAALGPDNPDTLVAMNKLATSYHLAGRRAEALKLREQVLALRLKASGPEDLNTLKDMNNLGNSYDEAGRLDEGLKLREQVLALARKLSGPEEASTLAAMDNLAISYEHVGRWDAALKLREEVFTLYRKVLGPDNPDTLDSMGNLAGSYEQVGRREDALKLREQALSLNRKVNGPEHPATFDAMNNLATSYDQAGRHNEALNLRAESLALRRKALGPEHPDTIDAMGRLATSYDETGSLEEALKLREQVIALCLKVFGQQHPHTLWERCSLATSYAEAGRRQEAIDLLEKACESDPRDTDALFTLATWQTWFGQQADYQDTCRRLLQEAETTEQAGVAESAANAACSAANAICLRPSTNTVLLTNGLRLPRRAVELGKTSSSLPSYKLSLGLAQYRNGQYAAAEGSLAAAELALGDQDEMQGIAHLFHALALFRLDRLEEARKLFRHAEAQMPPLPKDEGKPRVDGMPLVPSVLMWWLAYKEAKSVLNEPVASKP